MSKIDRIGEKNINNFGSEMVIIEYKNVHDIDVYFPEYDWIFKSATYQSFKKGKIKCPYDRNILVKHNKIYSPENCMYVPYTVNMLFTKRQNNRGKSVIGASVCKNGKYAVQCRLFNPETGKSKKKSI